MKQKECKISIIIPVYNSEKYLRRCIESILAQSFQDFEIIMINDGSIDDSLKILEYYKKKDKRIRIINQKNKGPGFTRNVGIEKAKGKFILFIDSDDYIDNNYIEMLYNAINNTMDDIVVSGFRKISYDYKKVLLERKTKNGEFAKYIVTGPVSKIYRRDFLTKNNIIFNDKLIGEDVIFNLTAYSKNAKVSSIEYIGYNYVTNNESLTNTLNKGFSDKADIIDTLIQINNIKTDNIELNQYFIIRLIISYLLYGGKSVDSKDFINQAEKMFNWLIEDIPNYKKNKYLKKKPKGELWNIYMIIIVFLIILKLGLLKMFSKIYCKGRNV